MKTITLCGSFTFAKRFIEIKQQLENFEWRVFTPTMDAEQQYQEAQSTADPEALTKLKQHLIKAHIDRIKQSDAILVINDKKHGTPGYVGANTLIEIGAALALGKKIYMLYQVSPDSKNYDEISALGADVLNGSLEILKNQKEKL